MRSHAHPTRLPRYVTVVLAVLVALLGPVGTTAALGAAGVPRESDPVGVWPLAPEPEVVGAFDAPDGPYGAGHRGVDLRGSSGQAVRSALPGTVRFAGRIAGRGVVVVGHGATRTTYEPVTATAAVGTDVGAGDVIGALELAGSHCFPRACLHWGWIEGASTYLDPLRLVGDGPVRLLPLWRDAPVTAGAASGPAARSAAGAAGPNELWRALTTVF